MLDEILKECKKMYKEKGWGLAIQYPNKISEFEIQAELYIRLKMLGYDIRGGVYAGSGHRLYGKGHSILDLVVFYKNLPQIIIEVKNYKEFNERDKEQRNKYKELGCKLLYCMGVNDIDTIINKVKDFLKI